MEHDLQSIVSMGAFVRLHKLEGQSVYHNNITYQYLIEI